MGIAKRLMLFMSVNILVVVTISIILSVLGVRPYLTSRGIDYQALMIFCLIWGMVGSFISLGLSRIMAKWAMGVQVISPQSARGTELALVEMVHRLSRGAGLQVMPEVGIYDSPEVNAFATGPTKKRALVAVSTGLLHRMNQDEVEGVLAHEVAHVANGDMVTMALIQGIVNAFVMFLARVVAFVISQNVREESRPMVQFVTVIALEILFGMLGMIVVSYFSRAREYRADAGGARLAGSQKMIQALERLQRSVEMVDKSRPAMASMKISNRPSGFLALFSTHPPLEDRIARLSRGAH